MNVWYRLAYRFWKVRANRARAATTRFEWRAEMFFQRIKRGRK